MQWTNFFTLRFLVLNQELQDPPFGDWSSVLHIRRCNHRRHLVDGCRLLRGNVTVSDQIHFIFTESEHFCLPSFRSRGFRLMLIGHSQLRREAFRLVLAETRTSKELSLTRMHVLGTMLRSFYWGYIAQCYNYSVFFLFPTTNSFQHILFALWVLFRSSTRTTCKKLRGRRMDTSSRVALLQ